MCYPVKSLLFLNSVFRYFSIFLLLISLNSCANANSPQVAQTSPAPQNAQSLSCKTDSDCPVLPCGPCTSGTVITQELLQGPSCTINPCQNAASLCNEQKICVVHPQTEKNPKVWKKK